MDINKIISLILGLLVVILLLVWVNNRFKAQRAITTQIKVTVTPTRSLTITPTVTKKNNWGIFSFLQKATPTPTKAPTPKPTTITLPANESIKSTPSANGYGTYTNNQHVPPMKEIPNTGVETFFLPSLLSSLGLGIFLSKSKKQ